MPTVARVVEESLYPARLDGLRFISVDEFGYPRPRRNLATVVDQGRRRAVWAGNRNGDRRLYDLFDAPEDNRTAALEVLTMGMSIVCEHARPTRTPEVFQDRLSWGGRSRLRPSARAARRIRKYQRGILFGLTTGLMEGIPNLVRIFARRAFGFHSAEALIAVVYRCCEGISLHPLHPVPT
jgi:hypothetical protein